ncbi:nSTAND1 domain-containing NTPase [Actinomadura kijaniata]|uniref:nSTAND1 domain-containing NTPase n=1 Tax=Actinomadura kijaniata TaxID=46161 RepID=UPI003F1D4AAA
MLDTEGMPVGFGLLLAPGKVVTCAHVIAQALNKPEDLKDPPAGSVTLDFPFLDNPHRVRARIAAWHAMERDGDGDIAGLELLAEPPADAHPVQMARGGHHDGREVLVYGYQNVQRSSAPTWVPGQIAGQAQHGWLHIRLSTRTGGLRIRRGFSGTPVWDRRHGQVIGLVVRSWLRADRWSSYALSANQIYQAWPELRAYYDLQCPFRALAPFEAADGDLFFGRADLARTAIETITGSEYTVVTGACGVGKSSLLNAAVLPALRRRGHAVLLLQVGPDDGLWTSIAAAVATALHGDLPDTVFDTDGAGGDGQESLHSRVHRLSDALAGAQVVVVVDQFEQVLLDYPHQAPALLAELVELPTVLHPHGWPLARVVLVVDDRFTTALLASSAHRSTSAAVLRVEPMEPFQLRQAIEGPLHHVGYAHYEDGLVDRIVDDLAAQPHALVTLQVVLSDLWRHKTADGTLRISDYDRLNRARNPLACYLTQIWSSLSATEQGAALRLLPRLTMPGDGGSFVRRQACLAKLPATERQTAATLASRKLVTVRGQGPAATVALVYDALISQWPTLAVHLTPHREPPQDRAEPHPDERTTTRTRNRHWCAPRRWPVVAILAVTAIAICLIAAVLLRGAQT